MYDYVLYEVPLPAHQHASYCLGRSLSSHDDALEYMGSGWGCPASGCLSPVSVESTEFSMACPDALTPEAALFPQYPWSVPPPVGSKDSLLLEPGSFGTGTTERN